MWRPQLPALIFAAGLLAWIAGSAIAWLGAPPLGHDEAQYALSAVDMMSGAEPRWFYVSSGMSVIAAVGRALGDGEIAMRVPSFLLGIGFVLAAAALAWRTFGATTAAWTVAALAGLRAFVVQSADLLTDLPATAFLLAGTLLILEALRDEEPPPWRVVAAAPLLAAALYIRYASCIPIAILGVAALAFGWRQIARRPLPIAVTVAVFALLLVPHFLAALRETGSPLGILLASKGVPGQTWIAQGLATYVTSNPFKYYGALAPPLLVAGIAAPIWIRDRRGLVLWVLAIADIVVLGLVSHAQVRYIFFGLALLVILGVDVIRRVIESRPPAIRRVLAIGCVIAVAAMWIAVQLAQARRVPRRFAGTAAPVDAARVIRADAAGARCQVVGDEFPMLEWYSGCRGAMYPWDSLGKEKIYVVTTPTTAPAGTRGTPTVLLERANVSVTRYDP